MQESKASHLAFLLETASPSPSSATHGLAARARQAQLLEDHNACVAAFAAAMRALASADRDAHAALVNRLTQLNAELGGPEPARH
jgi:hypothetical protein